jgi:hypothetical protein
MMNEINVALSVKDGMLVIAINDDKKMNSLLNRQLLADGLLTALNKVLDGHLNEMSVMEKLEYKLKVDEAKNKELKVEKKHLSEWEVETKKKEVKADE